MWEVCQYCREKQSIAGEQAEFWAGGNFVIVYKMLWEEGLPGNSSVSSVGMWKKNLLDGRARPTQRPGGETGEVFYKLSQQVMTGGGAREGGQTTQTHRQAYLNNILDLKELKF